MEQLHSADKIKNIREIGERIIARERKPIKAQTRWWISNE